MICQAIGERLTVRQIATSIPSNNSALTLTVLFLTLFVGQTEYLLFEKRLWGIVACSILLLIVYLSPVGSEDV